MELSKTFSPADIENKWYAHWMQKGYFQSKPDHRKPFTIVIPPPNVTGKLHMGHILNNTLQDIFIRRARMMGLNACWVPGTDHASIATEAKVVQRLRKQGIKKSDLSREEFLAHAWAWKEEHGDIILEQLKKLGASCDWNRTRFTMEEKLSKAVIKVFVDLYKKGFIYRDLKMVNWDPEAKTTLSNEEVIYKEEKSKLFFVRYQIEGQADEWVTIATTRPETILGDTAICVHPDDERYAHLKGKKALVPLLNRPVPIIFDEYVDREFGTGALKVTPAHDVNDYELGKKHHLETIEIFNPDGSLSHAAGLFIGQDRFAVRKVIVADLEAHGHLVKIEELTNKVGYSERTDVVIEPRLSMQWFVDMQKLVGPALENVLNNEIQFHPENFKNVYRHWMENIRDWPISRQLWWGQQIPVWYLDENTFFVAETADEALTQAREHTGNPQLALSDLRQEEDVVDTWFSSWLWPISVFDGFENPDNEEIRYYYPTDILITGWDIIFFWVARMIMAGYEYRQEKPFHHVYFTGMVRDKQRRKMSKSLGNSPEPLDLIENFGADGVRMGMLLAAPAGNDLLFDEKLCEQGRNFSNKIWNALRLVKGWEVSAEVPKGSGIAGQWFEARLSEAIGQINQSFDQFRVSEALMTIYQLIWDDFCSWYLEMVKPEFGKPVHPEVLNQTISFFGKLMQLLHPFMPFVTEEVWHRLTDNNPEKDIIISQWPEAVQPNVTLLNDAAIAREIIANARDLKARLKMKPRETAPCILLADQEPAYFSFKEEICKLAGLSELILASETPSNCSEFIVRKDRFFLQTAIEIDSDTEKERLEKEMGYTEGFLKSVRAKLSNERFVSNAPEAVLEKEKKKLQDGEEKLKAIQEALNRLQTSGD